MKRPYTIVFSTLVLIMLMISSCSTEKNTWVTRTYHNVTSYFNIYFNGNESFKQGLRKIERAHEDDYGELLPVFMHSSDASVGVAASDMDRAIRKSAKIITLKSITAKPEMKSRNLSAKEQEFYNQNEYNKWIDNSYLLTGKAHFHKHDFDLAIETFRHIVKDFPNEPTRYEAMVWMARSFIELGEMQDAKRVLDILDVDMRFPDNLKAELHTSFADYHMRMGNYRNALEMLEKSIDEIRGKTQKTRLTYLLAQIYNLNGDYQNASKKFGEVIKMNPPYEMTFNAKINKAAAFKAGDKNAQEIKAELRKMLRDEKNRDYHDQIYFAMANVSMIEGNVEEALENYKLSAESSVYNYRQKARSFVALADIYYERPEYSESQAYYDSAVHIIDTDFPRYDVIHTRAENLSRLISNLNTVELQDSLQLLAALDTRNLYNLIDGIIAKVREEELEAQRLEAERRQSEQLDRMYYSQTRQAAQSGMEGGNWYFYSPSTRGQGESEFRRVWGNRRLEDNWRRKSKRIISPDTYTAESGEDPSDVEGQQAEGTVLSNKTREFYLREIPLNDSLKALSHQKIIDGLYNAGLVYKNDLDEPRFAIQTFEELINRYPENDYLLPVLFYMYQLHNGQNNDLMARYYLNELVTKFPDSQYALLLANPDYIRELEEEQNKLYAFYEETYHSYRNNNYSHVIQNADYALHNFDSQELRPRFAYLRALSVGQLNEVRVFRETLNDIIREYPGTEVAWNARNIINQMDKEFPDIKIEEEKEIAAEIYFTLPDETHYFIFLIDAVEGKMNQLVFNFINFNIDHFNELNLNVNGESFNSNYQIATVKPFNNKESALQYLNTYNANEESVIKDIGTNNYRRFIISESNLGTLLKDKSLERYELFYMSNYNF